MRVRLQSTEGKDLINKMQRTKGRIKQKQNTSLSILKNTLNQDPHLREEGNSQSVNSYLNKKKKKSFLPPLTTTNSVDDRNRNRLANANHNSISARNVQTERGRGERRSKDPDHTSKHSNSQPNLKKDQSPHVNTPRILNCILVEGSRPFPRVAILYDESRNKSTSGRNLDRFEQYIEEQFKFQTGVPPRARIRRLYTIVGRELRSITELNRSLRTNGLDSINQSVSYDKYNSIAEQVPQHTTYLLCTSIDGMNERKMNIVLQEVFPDLPYVQQQVRRNVVRDRSSSNQPTYRETTHSNKQNQLQTSNQSSFNKTDSGIGVRSNSQSNNYEDEVSHNHLNTNSNVYSHNQVQISPRIEKSYERYVRPVHLKYNALNLPKETERTPSRSKLPRPDIVKRSSKRTNIVRASQISVLQPKNQNIPSKLNQNQISSNNKNSKFLPQIQSASSTSNTPQPQDIITPASNLQTSKSAGQNDDGTLPNYADLVVDYKLKLEKERENIKKSLKKDAEIKIGQITEQFRKEKEQWMSDREKNFEKERERLKQELESTRKEKSSLRQQNIKIQSKYAK